MDKMYYLAGPVDAVESIEYANEWREDIIDRYPSIDWINPINLCKHEDRKSIPEVCKNAVKDSDGILMRVIEPFNTCGTYYENHVAYSLGIPSVLLTDESSKDDIPVFLEYHSDAITTSVDDAVSSLVNSGREWNNNKQPTSNKWD